MENASFSITIQGDSEGYVTFECPFCGAEFKLQSGEYQDEEFPLQDLFCILHCRVHCFVLEHYLQRILVGRSGGNTKVPGNGHRHHSDKPLPSHPADPEEIKKTGAETCSGLNFFRKATAYHWLRRSRWPC